MEVQVDAFGDAPPDTFLALRIGDVQKQSRFSDSRTFKFPKGAPNGFNFGRVEVFKRIGHLTVRLDDLEGGAKDVEVPCDYPGTRQVSMRLAVRGGQLDHLPGLDAKSGAKFKQRQDTAQRYLEEHKLEELLADAMKHLIHKKPHNPHQFLSKFILQRSSTPPLPSIYQALLDLVSFSFATNQPHTRAPLSNMLPDFVVSGPDFRWRGYGGIVAAGYWDAEWRVATQSAYFQC
mmetsp:Transcript_122101/g.390516  ORF Transcript_122101/g.390516 Transcript_122101/m.390516 type:complete len:233 (+) Transcript_122101:135-833(+)